ncbi:uncharacterized protein [Panulirus ornatus]|uniref:uncharacterized protein n=1 Tax=Panulirus ornatus TaxID=150431 RepID=UPI003A85E556
MEPWSTQHLIRMVLAFSWLLLPAVCPMPGVSRPQDAFPFYEQQRTRNYSSCVNGYLEEDLTCSCSPCWEGPTCATYVDYYAPRFLVHAATAVLPLNATGVVYRAWSTDEDLGLTCPLGPGESARCPCASVVYQLFAPPGDHHFLLDQVSGILSRNNETSLEAGTTYTYKLMVQGTPAAGQMEELLYDLLDLRIYVSAEYVKKIPWT